MITGSGQDEIPMVARGCVFAYAALRVALFLKPVYPAAGAPVAAGGLRFGRAFLGYSGDNFKWYR